LQQQTGVVNAIRTGDGHAAARLARQNLFDCYAGYVPEPDRDALRVLIDET
jgi:hypothetical protein